jgi:hypothetical protein
MRSDGFIRSFCLESALERSYAVVLEPEAAGGFSFRMPTFSLAKIRKETLEARGRFPPGPRPSHRRASPGAEARRFPQETYSSRTGRGWASSIAGGHVGCAYLLERIGEIRPRVHAFGHIDEGSGVKERGGTTFVNASICSVVYDPVDPLRVIDIG